MTVIDPTFYAAATEAGILNAAALANSAGGGRVVIPPGSITMSQSLPAYDHVWYVGQEWGPDHRSAPAEGGTILVAANNSIIGYSYNTADLGTPPSNFTAFINGMLTGAGLINLSFTGFSYGIKIGGLYNPGAQSLTLNNIFVSGSVNWDIYLENIWCCEIRRIDINASGVGAFAVVSSGTHAIFNPGNTAIDYVYVNINGFTTRGVCAWARANSSLNQVIFTNTEPDHNFITNVVQAATMANASSNITVTDGTKFPVGMPATFSASVNGLVGAGAVGSTTAAIGQTYFVLTNNGSNVITVGSTPYDSTFTATGNSAVNIQTNGFALFEAAAQDSGSTLTAINLYSPDFEGTSTTLVLFVNTYYCLVLGGFIDTGASYETFCFRGVHSTQINTMRSIAVDADAASSANMFITRDSVKAVGFDYVPIPVSGLGAGGTFGRTAFVSDATVTTFASIVIGGGSNKVPVYDDGTNWRIG